MSHSSLTILPSNVQPALSRAHGNKKTHARRFGASLAMVLIAAASASGATAPSILVQPESQTVMVGQRATFSVVASGSAPLIYRWVRDGYRIPGARESSYTTPEVSEADNGASFTVTVSNSAGRVTSHAAILTVVAVGVAPTITTQPQSQTVTVGQTATFSVVASGTAPLSYQWKKSGTAIAGAAGASYTTPATVQTDNGASFTVTVTNTAGSVTSNAAILTVKAVVIAPTITTQPVSQMVTVGQVATFSVVASGTAPLSYQWKKNGTAIAGATAAVYVTPATTAADSGSTFTVTVTNSAGSLTSSAATLTVTPASACGMGSYVLPAGPTYSTQTGSRTLSRTTTWAPGISGGVPQRTAICSTLSPLGNGGDDGAAITAAIGSCPDNEVVMLNPGTYSIKTAVQWPKSNVVLRGSGGPGAGAATQTRLMAASSLYGPVVNIGLNLFPHPQTTSANLTADAIQGTNSVTVSSTTGFNVGDLVLIDMLVDPADDTGSWIVNAPAGGTGLVYPYAEYNPARSPKGDASRGWFNRTNRPVSQIMEIQSIAGNTVNFSTPFHMTFDVAHTAQMTGFDTETLANSGIENLYVSGVPAPGGSAQYNNIVLNLAKYSWVKNVESDQSQNDSIGIDQSFRCIVRDSYMHSTINPTPGGAGYGLEFSFGSADNLVENSISWNFNKVDVMRASGGGNVLAYNYMDDGWIAYQPDWVESGINAAHMTTPHFELFEGNLSFALGTDDTWGDSVFITWLRNVATNHRSAWPPLNTYTFNGTTQTTGCTSGGPGDYNCIAYTDVGNREAAMLTYGDVYFNEIGNVLGSIGMPVAPETKGFTYANSAPDWISDPVPMWMVGFGDWNGNSAVDQGVVNTILRDGNYDYATNGTHWNGVAQTLPASLYTCSKPAFFGSYNWPWADGSNASNPYYTHAFQYYPLSPTLGTFGTSGTMVTYPGYQLPAYVRFLQLHGIEQPPAACGSATLSNMPAACSLLFTGVVPNAATGAPTITTQPQSQTVTAGQTATFTVAASGTAPLSYQWQQNGAAIAGAVSSSYTTPATTTSESGSSFTVTVTDTAGSVTSTAATLTVNPAAPTPQTITFNNPGTQTVGTTRTLSATASSGLAVSFASTTTGVCTVSGTTASFVAAGTCTIQATQAGNGTYAPATPVSQSFTVNGTIPIAPAGLTATAGNASVSLTWTAVTGAASYNVYRGTSSGGESTTPIATGIATAAYTDTTVTNGTTYYYKVAAVNGGGTSGLSSETSATPSATVARVAVTANVPAYNFQVLPGSTRQINVNITGGTLNTVNWSWQSTGTKAATASFTTPAASGVSTVGAGLATVQVNIGAATGNENCTINGSVGAYTVTSPVQITVTAQSVDDPTKTGTFVFNVCAKTTTVVVAPAYQQAYQGQHMTLQSWVSGDTDETGTWSIVSQPGGGNGVLADTTNRDTDFVATVTGRYTIQYTSHSNPAKSATAIVYVSPNAMPSYVSTPNRSAPHECYVDPALTGKDYEVGAGKAYATISSTPAIGSLAPGSIIRIWNTDTTGSNPSTFHEYYQIASTGTPTQPIVMCGVPDSLGNLPIVDGSNATGQSDINTDGAAAGAGIVSVWTNGSHYGYWQAGSAGPSYVSITGLHIRNANVNYSYYPPGSATLTKYGGFVGCVSLYSGTYIDVSGNELDNCGLGLFTMENANNGWATITQAVTVMGNHIQYAGEVGDYSEHEAYFQAWYGLMQGNLLDNFTSGAEGGGVKWRGVEGIFRYNDLGSGPSRDFDLVENQDAASYVTFEGYLGAPGDTECDDSFLCLGDTLGANGLAAYQESAQKDFIYGNTIFGTSAQAQIHYAEDNTGGMNDRNGTLYFYSNTLDNAQIVFDTGENGDGYNPYLTQRIDARNNILWARTKAWSGITQMEFGSYASIILNAATNLMQSGTFTIAIPIEGAIWQDGTAEGWSSTCDGTCLWPLTVPLNTHLYGLSNANYLTTGTLPYNGTTLVPVAGSAAIEAGTALSGVLATMPVRWQYSIATNSLTPRLDPLTVGAEDYPAVVAAPPAPTGLTATPGKASISLTWNASSGAASYNVYRGTTSGGESAAPIATGVATAFYTDTTVTNGTTYYYKVAAVNGGGTSGPSSETSATPEASSSLLTPTVSVSPTPTTLSAGSTLSVQVTVTGSGATPTGTVTLSGGGYAATPATLAGGSHTYTIPANTLSVGTDTLTASYSGDSNYLAATGTSTVIVSAPGKPTISSFTASPASIASGASSTLSWATTGATGIAIAPGTFTSTSASGSTSVHPTATTIYTLTATNASGSATSTAQVTVTASGGSLAITTKSCPGGTQGAAYAGCTIVASGGSPPYAYSVSTSLSFPTLPEGMSLNATTGVIGSSLIGGQGTYTPELVVTDSAGAKATQSISFAVNGNNAFLANVFPSNSIFHHRVDAATTGLPVDTSPAAPMYSGYLSSTIKPFFGNNSDAPFPNGIPAIEVPYNQPDVSVTTNEYANAFTSGPIPAYAPVEGTANSTGDRHVLVYLEAGGGNNPALYEMWQGIYEGGPWTDSGDGYFSNVSSNALEQGGSDAAGLPVAPLLANADEVIGTGTPSAPNGTIQHPIRFTLNHMLNYWVWPGTATAGVGSCTATGGSSIPTYSPISQSSPPASCTMSGPAGEIYRLKASVTTPSCASTSPQAAIIITAFRNYGIILADNGISGGLIGTPDARWNDNDLECLTSLTLGNFEPVNVSSLMVSNGSGATSH